MNLLFLGHSAFQITTDSDHSILIDPYMQANPLCPVKPRDIKVDYIILTHAHGDHLGDAEIIGRRDNTFICVSELAVYLVKKGLKTHAMQIGGSYKFSFGTVKLTPALHGSMTPDGQYAGLAAGAIIFADGKTIYHTGDTGIFGDMKHIGEMYDIDYLLIPIGGNYTMDIKDAALATSWIKPKIVIPMHYNTFPLIETDPEVFSRSVSEYGIKCQIMTPGERLTL